MNYSNTWKYYSLDNSTSKNVNKIFDNEIFETLTEKFFAISPSSNTYSLRPFTGGYISKISTANNNNVNGFSVNYTCGGLNNCLAASPAYTVHCVCPENQQTVGGTPPSQCFIQVGGLDPNATGTLGGVDYTNSSLSTSSCCSVTNMPATAGTDSCQYFDSMASCEAALYGTANSSSTSGYHGQGSLSGAINYTNVTADNPIVAVSGNYNNAGVPGNLFGLPINLSPIANFVCKETVT